MEVPYRPDNSPSLYTQANTLGAGKYTTDLARFEGMRVGWRTQYTEQKYSMVMVLFHTKKKEV